MWERVNIVFKLKSPLHIGYMPFKGSVVSPTRYYISGRNFWGAITKKITEHLFKDHNAQNYKEIGKQVMENFRFSYFHLFDGKTNYFPHYSKEGLKYDKIAKSEFEHRFIRSRISTEIDGSSGTAKDESLHEIEYINNKFKDENGNLKDVKIVGCIWVKENVKINGKNGVTKDNGIFIDDFNIIEKLILGGESKYGFGDVLFDSTDKLKFPIEVEENYEIKVKINKDVPLPAHLGYHKGIKFKGDIELLTGRGYFDPENAAKSSNKPGEIVSKPEYYFAPGTIIEEEITVEINWDGTLSKTE